MSQSETDIIRDIRSDYEHGFPVKEDYFFKSGRGLSPELVEAIFEHKSEPDWMRKFRHKSLDYFLGRPIPPWGADLSGIDFGTSTTTSARRERQADKWEDAPAESSTPGTSSAFPRRRKYLAGVGAQYESEVVYHKLQEKMERQGVIFLDMDRPARAPGPRQAVLRHGHPAERQQVRGAQLGRLVGRVVHLRASRRAYRDAAAGLLPHQRQEHGPVRANADHRRRGRVRALRRGAAPRRSTRRTRFTRRSSRSSSRRRRLAATTTIQNWSNNVYNPRHQARRSAYEGATMEWVDGNLGSKVTMKYPPIWLMGGPRPR